MTSPPIRMLSTRSLRPVHKRQMEQYGIDIDDHDFIKIMYTDSEAVAEIIRCNTYPFVFTSVHAVEAVIGLSKQYRFSLPMRTTYCIQGNTSDVAVERGFRVVASAQQSFLLAKEIQSHGEKAVFYCTSALRRKEMEQELIHAGIHVHVQEVYQKENSGKRLAFTPEAILFFSPSQVDSFLEKNTIDPATPVFCIGQTTATYVVSLQHSKVIVADTPSEEAMINKVCRYFNIV